MGPRLASRTRRSWKGACAGSSGPRTSDFSSGLTGVDRATGADQARRPVRIPEIADGDAVALVHGVHELAIAQVNADVAQTCAVRVGEDEDVARREVVG